MFAPMTAHTEYARYEAETQERQRKAALLVGVQMPEGYSLLNDVVRAFTDWALRRRPATPAASSTEYCCE